MLPNGKGLWSQAAAVNTGGSITGALYNSSLDYSPAVWPTARSAPRVLSGVIGLAWDINDGGLGVGTEYRNGSNYAFLWEPNGALTYLPALRAEGWRPRPSRSTIAT